MTAATILIVEDHPLFVEGFGQMARALRPDWVLHSAGSAVQALHAVDSLAPDLAIIDVGLPDTDGFALTLRMAETRSGLPVVLISGRDDEAVRVRARASLARGFIAKSASPEVIVAQVDEVLRGGTAFAAGAIGRALPVLTNRQAEILALLGEGHANKEIRHRLGIAERTVRAHLTELFQALGANSRMQAVIRARELGLIS